MSTSWTWPAKSSSRAEQADRAGECGGCFYGGCSKPQYAIWISAVLAEWGLDYFRTFRHGKRFNRAASPR